MTGRAFLGDPNPECPRLENGDRLIQAEFHRQHRHYPEIEKAEPVEGVVHVGGRVGVHHSQPHGFVVRWLVEFTLPGIEIPALTRTTVILDADNEVQPDACMYYADGRSARPGEDGYVEGAPDLIVEVAATSASYDLHSKPNAYRRNGVQEYVVWPTFGQAIDWFELGEGAYHRLDPDANGTIHCRVFPGLPLSTEKMLAGDMKAVLREKRRRAPRS